jgi:signal peptidase II
LQAARGASIADETPPEEIPNVAEPDADGAGPDRRRLIGLFAAVALVGVGLDLLAKTLAVRHLDPADPVRLLGGLLTLRLIRNPGAAFSLGERFTVVFALLAIAVLIFILVRLVPRIAHAGWAVALGLLCAGITGNLIDRLFRAPGVFRGHVVDFFQLPHFAIFNVADMCITAAAVMIVVLAMVKGIGVDGHRYTRDESGA